MIRRISTLTALLVPAFAAGQDMPLSQIIPEGTGWIKSREEPFKPHDLPGALEFTPCFAARVPDGPWFMTLKGKTGIYRVTETGACSIQIPLGNATGVAAWPDGGTLVVADSEGKHLWAFRITEKGELTDGERYYGPRVRAGEAKSGVQGLAVDLVGRLYAATPLGVQVFDTTGRLSGVLNKPCDGELTRVRVFADHEPPMLSVICGGVRYDRPLKASGLKPTDGR